MQCPICCDVVCTIYGLWFHVTKRHPNHSTSHCKVRCPVCHSVFKGLQKLDSHIHGSHLASNPAPDQSLSDDDEKDTSDVAKKLIATSKILSPSSPVGPQEMLMQLDFSCDKFALVAQVSAEHLPARRATKVSAVCRSCDRSFPCSAALKLHAANLHDEAKHALSCTACSLCFVSHEDRDKHMMLTHDAPQVVVEFLRSSEDCDPRVGKVTREEFLLVLGLKALPVIDDASQDVASPESVDANQNLVKTMDMPVSISLNLTTPLVMAPLMALAPVTQLFSGTVPVPSVLPPHNPSLISSPALAQSAFQLMSTSNTVTFLSDSGSIQSIAAMTGSFPFLPPFVPPATLVRQSAGAAANAVKTSAGDGNLSAPVETVGADGDAKLRDWPVAEESNRMSMYCCI